ncbi:MAG: hypothetical protein ACK5U7_10720, partial [Bacteroidota bacterium]
FRVPCCAPLRLRLRASSLGARPHRNTHVPASKGHPAPTQRAKKHDKPLVVFNEPTKAIVGIYPREALISAHTHAGFGSCWRVFEP